MVRPIAHNRTIDRSTGLAAENTIMTEPIPRYAAQVAQSALRVPRQPDLVTLHPLYL